jgi:hypothetical protein
MMKRLLTDMRCRSVVGVLLGLLLSVGVIGTALAADPHSAANPTGPPNQSCQLLAPASPGHASTSPGSPFNEPGSGVASNPGGTGGQHYAAASQYDVACFQAAQH